MGFEVCSRFHQLFLGLHLGSIHFLQLGFHSTQILGVLELQRIHLGGLLSKIHIQLRDLGLLGFHLGVQLHNAFVLGLNRFLQRLSLGIELIALGAIIVTLSTCGVTLLLNSVSLGLQLGISVEFTLIADDRENTDSCGNRRQHHNGDRFFVLHGGC